MLRSTVPMLIDQLEKKIVPHKEEETKSSVQSPTDDVILNAHSMNPRTL